MGCPKQEKFGFKHWAPQKHTQGRWIKEGRGYVSLEYFAYKLFVVSYLVGYYTWNHVSNRKNNQNSPSQIYASPSKYWIYLTDWGYEIFVWRMILDFLMVCSRIVSVQRWPNYEGQYLHETNHFGNQFLWFMTTLSYTIAVVITLAFWTCLVPLDDLSKWTPLSWFTNINVHLIQGVLSIVDTFVSSSPRRMAHMWAPVIFGLVYLIFNVAYTLSGGTDPVGNPFIYPITDWLNKPGFSSGMIFVVVIMCVLVHSGFWALVQGRDRLWKSKVSESGAEEKLSWKGKQQGSPPQSYGATHNIVQP